MRKHVRLLSRCIIGIGLLIIIVAIAWTAPVIVERYWIHTLEHGSDTEKETAVAELEKIGSVNAVLMLKKALFDPNRAIRSLASRAVGRIPHTAVGFPLIYPECQERQQVRVMSGLVKVGELVEVLRSWTKIPPRVDLSSAEQSRWLRVRETDNLELAELLAILEMNSVRALPEEATNGEVGVRLEWYDEVDSVRRAAADAILRMRGGSWEESKFENRSVAEPNTVSRLRRWLGRLASGAASKDLHDFLRELDASGRWVKSEAIMTWFYKLEGGFLLEAEEERGKLNKVVLYDPLDQATERYESLDPGPGAWYRQGSKRYEEVLAAFERGIALDRDYVSAWYEKGRTSYYRKRYREQRAAFREEAAKRGHRQATEYISKSGETPPWTPEGSRSVPFEQDVVAAGPTTKPILGRIVNSTPWHKAISASWLRLKQYVATLAQTYFSAPLRRALRGQECVCRIGRPNERGRGGRPRAMG